MRVRDHWFGLKAYGVGLGVQVETGHVPSFEAKVCAKDLENCRGGSVAPRRAVPMPLTG